MSNDNTKVDPETQAKLDAMFAKMFGPYLPTLEQQMKEAAEDLELGKTGTHPDGKMTDGDQGELKLAVVMVDGKIIMNFGHPVTWCGMQPAQARAMAAALVTKAEEAEAWLAVLAEFKETQSDG